MPSGIALRSPLSLGLDSRSKKLSDISRKGYSFQMDENAYSEILRHFQLRILSRNKKGKRPLHKQVEQRLKDKKIKDSHSEIAIGAVGVRVLLYLWQVKGGAHPSPSAA